MTQMTTVTPNTARDIGSLLQSPAMLNQLKLALPKHITPERLARIALTLIRQNPELLECTRESLLGCILQSAQLGLEPGILGQAWIIPFKVRQRDGTFRKEATFIPGYRGLAQLAWRSAQVAGLSARAVFNGDVFVYDFGEDKISHKPSGETDPLKLTHAYAVIHTTYGGRVWDVMTRSEIEAIRKRSRAGESGPWKTDYAEMAKKTVFRRLMKIAPCSVEMQTALALDDAADAGLQQPIDFDIPSEALEAGPDSAALPEGSSSSIETTATAEAMVKATKS